MVEPWPDEVSNCEQGTKQHANATNDNIRNTQEGILPPHHSSGGDDDRFGTPVNSDRKICNSSVSSKKGTYMARLTVVNIHLVASSFHGRIVIPQSQLAERGQPSRPHPHLKLFIVV